VIKTAAQKISMLYPQYEYIAAKLFLLKCYKESGCKVGYYPHLRDVLRKGIQYKVYDKNIIDTFTDDDIEILNSNIDHVNDFLFTYKSLTTFYNKYCLNYSKNKKHKQLSSHNYAVATPIMIRSLTRKPQTASCVLTVMPDDTNGIMQTLESLAVYSKYNGGTATDVSSIRASGSYISGNNGYSSGPVAYLFLALRLGKIDCFEI